MPIWFVLVASGLYVVLLFGVAWFGDRIAAQTDGAIGGRRGRPILYALTLAIYSTSWSFYGSVGRAATHGFDFFAIYLGPCLLLIFGWRIVVRMIDISKAQNITSIADFIGSRYGKSQHLAALVTVAATLGVVPYIALQLKAITASYAVLTGSAADAATLHPIWLDPAFIATMALALFTILFGVRHIHASEHHRGLMLAIAVESVIKLAAFLIVATFIVYGLSGGVGGLLDRAAADPRLAHLLALDLAEPPWLVNTILAGLMILCLPQIFHVLVVENEVRSDVRVASWLFPGYLLALSPLMMPIAIAGLLAFADGSVDPDTFVIRLPMAAGYPGIGLIAFIGGLSAATAMVVVSTVALATMICNDAVMPLLLRIPALGLAGRGGDRTGLLLRIRRLAVMLVLLLAYATFRAVGDTAALVSMGLVTFVAIAQFAPALLGGLFWAGGSRNGAIGGLSAGLALWAYTLVLPLLATSGLLPADWLQHGPAGLGFLRPQALFGLGRLDPVSHAAVWSLAANMLVYVGLSLAARPSLVERLQANVFTAASDARIGDGGVWRSLITTADLEVLVARFVGPDKAAAAFRTRQLAGQDPGPGLPAGLVAVRFAERLLAGAIGAASARVVIATMLETKTFSRSDAMAMLDQAQHAIRLGRELLLVALENMIQGMCVFDANLHVAAWNQRLLRLLELPDDLIQVGTHLSDITRFNVARGELSARDVQAQLSNRDLSRQTWPYTYERRRLDGTVIEVTYNPIPDGRGFVSTITDITERTRAAAEIERVGRLRRFLPPQVTELIVSSDGEALLESHRREVTVVFCDLRGFTAFAERASPEEVMGVLHEYHAALGLLIHRFEGTLERFLGDGLMVLFNDPVPCSDPAERAVRMSVAMRDAIRHLAIAWRGRGFELGFGIGIAQGEATLGRIGFEGRYDYAAIGRVSNLSSRLCAEARDGQILVSQTVSDAVSHIAVVEPLVPIVLKGFLGVVPLSGITALTPLGEGTALP